MPTLRTQSHRRPPQGSVLAAHPEFLVTAPTHSSAKTRWQTTRASPRMSRLARVLSTPPTRRAPSAQPVDRAPRPDCPSTRPYPAATDQRNCAKQLRTSLMKRRRRPWLPGRGRWRTGTAASARAGCRARARSARPRCPRSPGASSSRVDQCVTPYFFGGGFNVAATTLRRSIVRGRPERSSSSRPAIPLDWYRCRHPMTVGRDTPTCAAIAVFPSPSAASNTIRARCASPARTLDERVNRSRWPRSPSRSSNAGAGRFATRTSSRIPMRQTSINARH